MPPSRPTRARLPPWRMSVRADNDAFNFWRRHHRPPGQGIHERRPGDGRVLRARRGGASGSRSTATPCTGQRGAGRAVPNDSRCPSARTCTRRSPGHEPRVVPDWRDDRPYAALAVRERRGARRSASDRCAPSACMLGVTGAAGVRRVRADARRTSSPAYTHVSRSAGTRRSASSRASCSLRGAPTASPVATSSGNAVVDFVPHDWRVARQRPDRRRSAAFRRASASICRTRGGRASGARARRSSSICWADSRGEAVAHNITLDGNTLGADRRVDRVPLVGEYSIGVGGALPRFRCRMARRHAKPGIPHRTAWGTRTARCSASYEVPRARSLTLTLDSASLQAVYLFL